MKKGFAFIETILTLTILMGTLLTLYTVFINLLQKEKVNAAYDRYGDKISLFYIKEIMKNDITYTYLDNSDEYVGDTILDINETDNQILNTFNLKTLVVGTCEDDNSISYTTEPTIANVSNDFFSYINTFKKCKDDSEIVLFGEFYVDNEYTYAHIFYPDYN